MNIQGRWRDAVCLDNVFTKVYSSEYKDDTVIVEGSVAGVSRIPFSKFALKFTVDTNGKIDFAFSADINE